MKTFNALERRVCDAVVITEGTEAGRCLQEFQQLQAMHGLPTDEETP